MACPDPSGRRKRAEIGSHWIDTCDQARVRWHLERPDSYGPFDSAMARFRVITVSRLLRLRAGDSILVVGAGSGWESAFFETTGLRVISCDISADMSKIAKMRRDLEQKAFEVIVCDGNLLPFPDQSIAAVLFADSLHHFEDLKAAVTEAMRVARAAIGSFGDPMDSVIRRVAITLGHDATEYSGFLPQLIAKEELEAILAEGGFRLLALRGFFDWLPKPALEAIPESIQRAVAAAYRLLNRPPWKVGSTQIWIAERIGALPSAPKILGSRNETD